MAEGKGSLFVGLGCAAATVVGLIVAGAAVAGYLYWSSPTYSLEQIKTAAEQGDVAAFEKYVDLRSVCESGVDRFLDQAASGGDGDGGRVGRAVGVGFLRLLKPAMVDGLQREIRKGVGERRAARPDRPQIRIQEVARSGDTAHVLLVVPGRSLDPPRDQDGRVRIRMRDMGHYWQAYEVVSLEGFKNP